MQCLLLGSLGCRPPRGSDRASKQQSEKENCCILRTLSAAPQSVAGSGWKDIDFVARRESLVPGCLGRWERWVTRTRPPQASRSSRWDMLKFIRQSAAVCSLHFVFTQGWCVSHNYMLERRGWCTECACCIYSIIFYCFTVQAFTWRQSCCIFYTDPWSFHFWRQSSCALRD